MRELVAEPIRAYKQTSLVLQPDAGVSSAFIFPSPTHPVRAAEAVCLGSECPEPEPHRPTRRSVCGFHGLYDQDEVLRGMGLQRGFGVVWLYGQVVRHRRGVRAQYQDVISVGYVPLCHRCHSRTDRLSLSPAPTRAATPTCDHCHTKSGLNEPRATPDDIAMILDIDVGWLPGSARDAMLPPW